MATEASAWFLEHAGQPLVRRALALPELKLDEALVEVLACGLCHTDLGYADGSVRPNHPLPLVLGHEAVGIVRQAGDPTLIDKPVIVPAVLPCGRCALCQNGRGNACTAQKMPGNDIHGGFASHMVVPAAPLVRLDAAPPGTDLRLLSVVADAVSTAWQAILRANVQPGDAVVLIGAGGVGAFVAQIAKALDAQVIACDVRDDKLAQVAAVGADVTINVRGKAPRDVRKEVHGAFAGWGIPSLNWRIFECSGTPEGQTLAFTLLARAATMVQVGFSAKPVELRFSNLMAFDATVHGTWGCPPAAYPDVLSLIWQGKIQLEPFCEMAPMSQLNQALADMAAHKLEKRMILDPRT